MEEKDDDKQAKEEDDNMKIRTKTISQRRKTEIEQEVGHERMKKRMTKVATWSTTEVRRESTKEFGREITTEFGRRNPTEIRASPL